jgi:CubicO group peptidase (beta-lactamase class C family)
MKNLPLRTFLSALFILLINVISCTNNKKFDDISISLPTVNDPGIEQNIDSLLLPLVRNDLISGNILIVRTDTIVFLKSYGLADRDLKIPNTPSTKFRISSITKTITAVAILQLHDKGLLDISEPIKKYFPEIKNRDKITIAHLLYHTSGLPSYDWTMSKKKPQKMEVVYGWIRELNPVFEPGDKFLYGNSGYALLAMIIEKVSGLKYEEYLQKNIFLLCGMKDTGLFFSSNQESTIASGYSIEDYVGFKPATRTAPLGRGDGDLYSTVIDLYKFLYYLYKDSLLSPITRTLMFTPHKNQYGLGWYIDDLFGQKVVYHPGGSLGNMSNIRSFNDGEIILINLFNSDFLLTHIVENELISITFGEKWNPILRTENDTDILNLYRKLSGEYSLDDNMSFSIYIDSGDIFFQETGRPPCKAYPFSTYSIYIKEINARIRFHDVNEQNPGYVGLFGLFQVTGKRIIK